MGPEVEWRAEEKQQGKSKAWSKSVPNIFTEQHETKETGEKSDRKVARSAAKY